jgi:hypothetical protein
LGGNKPWLLLELNQLLFQQEAANGAQAYFQSGISRFKITPRIQFADTRIRYIGDVWKAHLDWNQRTANKFCFVTSNILAPFIEASA